MFHRLLYKIKHFVVSLRFSILFIFTTLFLTTTILIIVTTSVRFSDTLAVTSLSLMRYASAVVLRELNMGMKPAEIESQFSANLMQEGVLKDDEAQLIPFTYHVLKNLPLAIATFWGDEDGDFVYSEKAGDGTITTEVYNRSRTPASHIIYFRNQQGKIIKQISSSDLEYDPRKRPWYIQAKQKRKSIWTDIYLFEPHPRLGITTASPVMDQSNQLIGVFGIDISLDYLTDFITQQKISTNGFSFIIDNEDNLIVYPKRQPFLNTIRLDNNPLTSVHELGAPLIDKSFDLYKQIDDEEFTFFDKHEEYLVMYEPVPAMKEYGWHIGVIIPKTDFTSALQKMNMITLLISLFILMLGVILVSHLITRIVKPIKKLVQETERIKNFDLDKNFPIHSRISEVIVLKNAIHAMKVGLKSFQKFVPKALIRQLIDAGEEIKIGGERKEITVLFSDIDSFTTIAEEMDANELMTQLCDYFETLSQIVTNSKGTIDKYIGDSLMAFWGAPLPEEKACYLAALTALLSQEKFAELNKMWQQKGKPVFKTRIGIHRGDAIVGNIGSSERLNYTALGDTINTASRLENINKFYKTKIMVSETVYNNIKNDFVLRMVDLVALKGRKKGTYIYELLSDNINKLTFDIVSYRNEFEKAFTAYQEKQWDQAKFHFQNCLTIYPNDTIAPIFIIKCDFYKLNPPAEDWKGITRI